MTLPNREKILHITFDMEIGGAEQVICQIIENSNSERFSHEIVCIDGKVGALGKHLESSGISVHATRRRPGLDFKLVGFIRAIVRKQGITVLHCHQYTPYFYGALASMGTGARLIFTEHGRFYPDRHNRKRRLVNPLLALMTDHITAISVATADAVAEYEYFPRNKIAVIYNGIRDLAKESYTRETLSKELGISTEYRYIGSVSRLEPIKNQVMMINAFQFVNQAIPETRLLLIGDGSARPVLEELVKSLNLQDQVIFTGFIDHPQRYINLFDIFLLSSFSEGTSMTLLESMCLSRPCVVTDVGGNSEIVINGQTGRLTPTDDKSKFANAILELLESQQLREEFGARARASFEKNFTAGVMIDSYQSMYLT